MALDTLEIFGDEFTNVTGIKATDDNDQIKVYIRPQGTKSISANGAGIDVAEYASVDVAVPSVESNFIVTVSWDSTSQKWLPDCTMVQLWGAFQAGKTIAVCTDQSAENATADGFWADDELYVYVVRERANTALVNRVKETIYVFSTSEITVFSEDILIEPSGNLAITQAGATDVTNYATASVAAGSATAPATISGTSATVSTGTNTLTLSKTVSVTPTVAAGYVSSGTAGNSSVSLTASVTTNPTPTVSGDTVTIPAGYYSSQTTKSVTSGTAGTPTASKGTVSNHAISVTPSVTNTTGYITGGTKTGTAVSVSASELVSGTYSVTSSGTKDVTNYASASVPAGTAGTPSATKGSVSNHAISVTPSVTNTTGFITGSTKTGTAVSVSASELVSGTLSVTTNGTSDVTNYASVNVAIPIVAYYTGTATPPSSLGDNGSLYLKVVS